MSYILQALKKSEQARELAAQHSNTSAQIEGHADQQGEQYESMLVAGKHERTIPLTIYAWVGGLFIMLLLVSSYMSQSIRIGQKEVANNAEIHADKIIRSEAVSSTVVAQRNIPTAREAEVLNSAELANPSIASQEKTVSVAVLTAALPNPVGPPLAAEQAGEDVQSLIPNLEITSHIYSSLPMRRSIVVNGGRLVESDFITPQVQVQEITHQGMIIRVNGWSLVIDRSRGWSR